MLETISSTHQLTNNLSLVWTGQICVQLVVPQEPKHLQEGEGMFCFLCKQHKIFTPHPVNSLRDDPATQRSH